MSDITIYNSDAVEIWAECGDRAYIHFEVKKLSKSLLKDTDRLTRLVCRELKNRGYKRVYALHHLSSPLSDDLRLTKYFGFTITGKQGEYLSAYRDL